MNKINTEGKDKIEKERYCVNCGKSEKEIRLQRRITGKRVYCTLRYTHKYKMRKIKL